MLLEDRSSIGFQRQGIIAAPLTQPDLNGIRGCDQVALKDRSGMNVVKGRLRPIGARTENSLTVTQGKKRVSHCRKADLRPRQRPKLDGSFP